MKNLRFILWLIAIAVSSGCVRDPLSVAPVVPVPSAKGVYIVNQGNFGRGNATLSYFDLENFQVYNDVFSAVNGKNLGDVGQSMVLWNGRGYILVNDSHKIEVIDLSTNVDVETIDLGAGASPRQMAFVNDSLALVTDLYSATVLKVDVAKGSVAGAIPVGQNPEGIVLVAGKAFIANSGFGLGTSLSIIDLATLSPAGSIPVDENPIGMAVTPDGLVYALCAGAYGGGGVPETFATIMVVDPRQDAVVDSISVGGHASALAIGADGTAYVAGDNSVLAIDARIHRVRGVFVTGSFDGVGVEIVSGDVYLADAKQYVQPGTVYVYAANGILRTRFDVGIIPGAFAFKR